MGEMVCASMVQPAAAWTGHGGTHSDPAGSLAPTSVRPAHNLADFATAHLCPRLPAMAPDDVLGTAVPVWWYHVDTGCRWAG